MADTVEEAQSAAEIEGQANGGLMSLLSTYLPPAIAASNATRAGAYQNLLDACQEFRTLLNNVDPAGRRRCAHRGQRHQGADLRRIKPCP